MLKNNKRPRFCLEQSQSPTFYNLHKYLQQRGWRYTRFNCLAAFGERNFQFDQTAAETLEFKHLLAQLVNQYCPQIMPETYCINDQNWPLVLSQIADNTVWILKPSLLNNGQEIKLFQQVSQLEQHYLHTNRLGGEHVLQRYITQPHLLKGHKYSIRMFVIATNDRGIQLYPYGYFNVALQPYEANNFKDLRPHLTNEHLDDKGANVLQIPTEKFDFFPTLFPQINTIVSEIMQALQKQYPQAFICQKQANLAIFGFDFMVDASLRLWLLEANHGPCFPISDEHPLQKYLYYDFWQGFIDKYVMKKPHAGPP